MQRAHQNGTVVRRVRRAVLAVLVLGGGLFSAGLFRELLASEHRYVHLEFRRLAEHRVDAVRRALADKLFTLETIASSCDASTPPARTEFATAAQPILRRFSDIKALAWVPRVPGEQRTRLEINARADGLEKFQIMEWDSAGRLTRAAAREEYYVAYYVEPYCGNETVIGVDLATGPLEWAAMCRARDEDVSIAAVCPPAVGEAAASPLIRIFYPVYDSGGLTYSIERRRENLRGFVQCDARARDVVEQALVALPPEGVHTQLLEPSSAVAPPDLYGHTEVEPRLTFAQTIEFGGRQWSVRCDAVAGFESERLSWSPWLALAAGLVLTVLMAAWLAGLMRHAAKVEALVVQRTAALQESEQRYRAISESAQDAIVTADGKGRILFWNPAAERMFGITASEIQARGIADLIVAPRGAGGNEEGMAGLLPAGGRAVAGRTLELVALREDGSGFPVELSVSSYSSADGPVTVAVARDITERKRAEEALKETNRQLEHAVERANELAVRAEAATCAKSVFLANMSHEIRTPMTAILGFADVLLEEGDLESAPPERIEAAKTIQRNSEHLLGLINDILDLSKIEAGRFVVERVPCSPCEIIAEVASLMRIRSESKGVRFEVKYEGPIPERILSDPIRLRQILINLLGNAIKFTEAGSVRLNVACEAGQDDAPRLQFDVVDTGVGMTQEQVGKLFQPFTQADASTTRRFGGTGLGLVISKRLAELLGGDVTIVETREGAGTRMRATVPTGPLDGVPMIPDPRAATVLRAEETGTKTRADEPALHDCRVLLAEDGPDNQRLIRHVLKRAGAEVTLVENGKQAVEAALAARQEGHPFDVILMDMQMPVLDGYAATGLLRHRGYTGPIVALTAHAMSGDRERCLEAGCSDYATKPVDRRKLIETIRQHARPSPVPA